MNKVVRCPQTGLKRDFCPRVKNQARLWALAALACLALAPAPSFALAAGQTVGNDGRTCTVADRGTDVWFGFFSGGRSVFAPLKGDVAAPGQARWRCFEAKDACIAWMATMKNTHDVSANGRPAEAFCRQGG
ncbi:MAG: hypothetical protein HC779_00565 [Phyllobacteriaceae bacterium]|nr:hypothetical protein [Phyllobacteriaceae bacterium]